MVCWLTLSFPVDESVPITLRLLQPLVNLHCLKQPHSSPSSTLISLFVPKLSHYWQLCLYLCAWMCVLVCISVHLTGCEVSKSTSISSHSNLIINYSVPRADRSPNTVWHSFQGDRHKVIPKQDSALKKKRVKHLHHTAVVRLLNLFVTSLTATLKQF